MNINKQIIKLQKQFFFIESVLRNPRLLGYKNFDVLKFLVLYNTLFQFLFLKQLNLLLTSEEFETFCSNKSSFLKFRKILQSREQQNSKQFYSKVQNFSFSHQDELCFYELNKIWNVVEKISEQNLNRQIITYQDLLLYELNQLFFELQDISFYTSLGSFDQKVASFFNNYTLLLELIVKFWYCRDALLKLFFSLPIHKEVTYNLLISLFLLDRNLEILIRKLLFYTDKLNSFGESRSLIARKIDL